MYNLFLDDIRMPSEVAIYTKNPDYIQKQWIIARNYDQFVLNISERGLPLLVSFDHDLADEHYEIGAPSQFLAFDYSKCTEMTGYDAAKWLGEYCLNNKVKMPKYLAHSMNPIGRKNILSYLDNYIKYIDNGK
jgi:hypothetical protein